MVCRNLKKEAFDLEWEERNEEIPFKKHILAGKTHSISFSPKQMINVA